MKIIQQQIKSFKQKPGSPLSAAQWRQQNTLLAGTFCTHKWQVLHPQMASIAERSKENDNEQRIQESV